jgi:mannitol-1-phosphate/altronate dehydrogenase
VVGRAFSHKYCHEAISGPLLGVYLERIIFYEVFPALDFLDFREAYEYASDCFKRFQNDRLKENLERL